MKFALADSQELRRAAAWGAAFERALSLRVDLTAQGFTIPNERDMNAARSWADAVVQCAAEPETPRPAMLPPPALPLTGHTFETQVCWRCSERYDRSPDLGCRFAPERANGAGDQ